MVLEVVHETRYFYAAPVTLAHHVAHLRPLADEWQRVLAHALQIEPTPEPPAFGVDAEGNAIARFTLVQPHETLLVRATSRVALAPRFAALDAEAAPPWDGLVARLRYVARGPFEPAIGYAQPSPYVPRIAALRDYAAASFAAGRPVAAAALDLMHRVHDDFEYRSESTEVDTPLAQAFEQRSGVCQDFAHVMTGALRMQGVPTRYVSGYLRTQAPDGKAVMLGADASHAWVQVWCPGTPGVPADGWLDLDPTNDVVPSCGHVRVAVGRDYGDVAPLRGVIRGGGAHRLAVSVTTRRVGPLVASASPEGDRPP